MVESHFKIFIPVWKFCSNLKECSTYRNLMCSLTAKQALCTSCVKKTSHLKIWWLNIFQQTAYQSYHNFDVFVRTDTRLSQWNCISLISAVPCACATNTEILWLWIELVIIILTLPEEETTSAHTNHYSGGTTLHVTEGKKGATKLLVMKINEEEKLDLHYLCVT